MDALQYHGLFFPLYNQYVLSYIGCITYTLFESFYDNLSMCNQL
jgi:hypothetical protein